MTVERKLSNAQIAQELNAKHPGWDKLSSDRLVALVAKTLNVATIRAARNPTRPLGHYVQPEPAAQAEQMQATVAAYLERLAEQINAPGGAFDQAVAEDERRDTAARIAAIDAERELARADQDAADEYERLRQAAARVEDANRPPPLPSPAGSYVLPGKWRGKG